MHSTVESIRNSLIRACEDTIHVNICHDNTDKINDDMNLTSARDELVFDDLFVVDGQEAVMQYADKWGLTEEERDEAIMCESFREAAMRIDEHIKRTLLSQAGTTSTTLFLDQNTHDGTIKAFCSNVGDSLCVMIVAHDNCSFDTEVLISDLNLCLLRNLLLEKML